jgi:hypothetical protein
MDWMVYVESCGVGEIDKDAFNRFADALYRCAGFVGFGESSFEATLTIDAPNALEASTIGERTVREIAADVGLPEWVVCRLDARTFIAAERAVDFDDADPPGRT